MASTQKRNSATNGGGSKGRSASNPSKSGGKRAASRSGTQSKGRSRRSAPQKKPYRREVGGGVCFLLALFGAIGYFKTEEGAVIALFCDLLKGLCGYGFYLAPPMLLAAAVILVFHRGRPVRLRVAGAVCLPVFAGALLHLLLSRGEYQWGWELFGQLWTDGKAVACGGVASGTLAMAFRFAFTTVGAVAVLLLLTAAAALCALRLTPADVLDYLKQRREQRAEYDPDDYPEPEERPRRPARAEPEPAARRKNAAIDIPVDDGPLLAQRPTTPVTTVRKKSFFDKVAGVALPGQGDRPPSLEEEPPEYEDVAELRPMKEPPRTPRPSPVAPPPAMDDLVAPAAPTPIREEAPSAPAAQEDPVPPPVIREPAPQKRSKEEEQAQVREEMAREIEAGMEQDSPAYRYPPVTLLNQGGGGNASAAEGELHANQQRLQDALQSFGVSARIVNVIRGPAVTRYELELDQGVKLNKITNLSGDIALALGASAVRVAPIPDKISTVGIEVPNRVVSPVCIRDVLGSRAFTDSPSKVSFAVGKDISGQPIVGNIARLPHMLIAGTTGSGKSVCTNSLIISLLYKAAPEEVRLIMVDPKMVELSVYNGIPHLLIPVVTDPKKAAGALQWAVSEMMKRYQKFSEVGAKDLASYNNHAAQREDLEPMPQIVVVIDELADLMLVAAKEVEESICRVAQMGRASGMHLVIATQSPRADVITGLMKANIPSRIAFAVASSLESRIILDTTGAEKLVGKGDMLYAPLGQDKLRVQGCFITEEEVANVVDFIKEGASAQYDEQVMHEIEKNAEDKSKADKGVGGSDPAGGDDYDELLPAAIDVVLEVGQASVSMLQRRLKLGYGRAARLVDQMEEKGVVGPFEGSKPRQLLITKEQWAEMQYKQNMVAAVPDELPFEGDALPQERDIPPFDMDE
ncbi:MAG: DNA translocase FtsK [Oscillospiraceae bacterium]|nr:DNA translocase FtsK [Oscillospiraceae bacterium]